LRERAGVGAVPNELVFERGGADATVLNGDWLGAYNAAAREHGGREVHLYGALRTQLLAAVLGLLLVPAVALALARVPIRRLAASGRAAPALGAAIVVLALAMVLSQDGRRLPALLRVGDRSVTAYELLKVGLVLVVGLALARLARGHRRGPPAALAAAALASGAVLWLDPGAGIALLALGLLLASFVAGRRGRVALVAAGAVAICLAPLAVPALAEHLPRTIGVRLAMWSDPWGSYQRAEVENQAAASLARISGYREEQPAGPRRLAASGTPLLNGEVNRLEQELRWRLGGFESRPTHSKPLVPNGDPVDELLLLEAETLWSGLGGFRRAAHLPGGPETFAKRVDEAIVRLQAGDRNEPAVEPDNFQLQRALFALRKGGLLGVGLGRGRPEAVPGLTEDAPLAGVGESLGFAGIALVVLLLALVAGRGVEAARGRAELGLGLVVVGLASLFGLQALISLGGLTGLLPFTGLTFPFVSRSGTALVAGFVALALLIALAPRALPRASRVPRLLGGGGFPAALGIALAAAAALQLAGVSPAGVLPNGEARFLHAADQWRTPSYRVAPGPVLDRRGRVLAETRSLGAGRSFPDRELARSLGHTLLQLDLGFRERLLPSNDGERVGPALRTTIDADVQLAVHAAIDTGASSAGLPDVAALRGAVVLLDVEDGSIVALESRPSFSPAELSDRRVWASAEARERRAGFAYRYLNRAVHGFYPPGSIFKTVTAAAALERGLHTLHTHDFDYRDGPQGPREPDGLRQLARWHQLTLPDGPAITDANHPRVRDWNFDLEEAFAWSCNVAFAEIGLELGGADLISLARRFGFERPLSVTGLGTSTSTLDNDAGRPLAERYLARTRSNLARTAFGQGQARVTPLQMALVPAAIANDGTIMQPRLLSAEPPRVFSRTGFSATTQDELRELMWASATYGWARSARVNRDNVSPGVAGKTGSAEWSEVQDISHGWFIGYYPAERPRLAIAVVVERGGPGPIVAAQIARAVFQSSAAQRYVREQQG